jgi:spermidine synthase
VIVLFVVGALSMLAQVVILRELVAALFGVELLYIVALGSWLAGTAAGSLVGRRLPARPATAAAGCVALGMLVPIELVLVRTGGVLTGAVPGAFLPFPEQILWVVAATVPPSVVCGLLFPPLTGVASLRQHGLGRAYAVESAGAAVGGAVVTVCFWFGVSTLQVATCATVAALAAAAVTWGHRRQLRLAAVLAALALVAGAGMHYARPWDLSLLRWQYPSLVDARDTPYARVVLTRREGQLAVFQNGAFAFDTEGTSAEAFADLSAVQHPGPRRALVIGGGLEGVPAALHAHAVAVIDNLEVDERAFDLVRSYLPAPRRGGADSPGVRVVFGEPRRFLEQSDPYDLMLVATAEPTTGESSRFYTQEFFRQCARHLAPGGVIAVRLPAAENVWPVPLARRTASIFSALRHELTSIEVVPGATLYLFASDTPLSRDPAVFARRLSDRGVHARLMTAPYLHYLYNNDRRDDVRRMLAATPTGGANRDGAPICYQYAVMLWLAKFYPGLAVVSGATRGPPWWLSGGALLACAGAVMWLRRRARRRLAGLLFGAGLVGMVLETILLLRFQVANGVMFQQVGWLLTCFMAGLTIGGWAFGRIPPSASAVSVRGRSGWVPVTALFGVAAVAWGSSSVPAVAGLTGTSLMLLATGLVVGACFAFAAAMWPGDRYRAASSLYAADVAGGAAGAVLATLVLVPLAGLDGSALLMAGLAALLVAFLTAGPAAAAR